MDPRQNQRSALIAEVSFGSFDNKKKRKAVVPSLPIIYIIDVHVHVNIIDVYGKQKN